MREGWERIAVEQGLVYEFNLLWLTDREAPCGIGLAGAVSHVGGYKSGNHDQRRWPPRQ